jgi:hypothetical protein
MEDVLVEATPSPYVEVPIARADFYPHSHDLGAPITRLEVTHLVVDIDVVEEGVITLAASTTAADRDAYGIEFDLAPSAARQLAAEILAAVTRVTARES